MLHYSLLRGRGASKFRTRRTRTERNEECEQEEVEDNLQGADKKRAFEGVDSRKER